MSEEPASFIESLITRSGCSAEFYALELCLGERERSFRACQPAVKAFKACNAKQQQPAPATEERKK